MVDGPEGAWCLVLGAWLGRGTVLRLTEPRSGGEMAALYRDAATGDGVVGFHTLFLSIREKRSSSRHSSKTRVLLSRQVMSLALAMLCSASMPRRLSW